MSTIVTRAGKGSALTWAEMDANFTNLNTDKLQNGNAASFSSTQLTGGTGTEGTLSWNNTDGTLDLIMKGSNVTLQVGQEQLIRVLNNTGSAMTDPQVIRLTGSSGQRVTCALAQANTQANSGNTIAILTEPIANNQEGFATVRGLVRNVNTNAFNDGDELFLSPTVAGGITNVVPAAPNHAVHLGWCVRKHLTQGSIYVDVRDGSNLDELHDVNITAPSDGQVLKYYAAGPYWRNETVSLGTGDVTGQASSVDSEIALFSGTTGKVIKRATNTGLIKASSGVIATAVAGTDYLAPPSGTAILKANSGGALANAIAGTDYQAAITATGILKGAGAGSISAGTAGTDYVAPGTTTEFTKPQRPSVTAETAPSANAVTWDLTTNEIFRVNLNANITTFNLTGTLANLAGYQYEIIIRYNGGTTITWNSNFKWTAGTAPTLTGTSGKVDILTFVVASTDGTNFYLLNTGIKQNIG